MPRTGLRVGVISDTHAVLHPGVAEAFRRVDHILHAGDVGSLDVLDALDRLGPVMAIRGNADPSALAHLPVERCVELGGVPIVLVHHGLGHGRPTDALAAALARWRPRVVVFGHSHVALIDQRYGVLLLNPGGGGRRRFRLPRSVALLTLGRRRIEARIVTLD